MAGINYSKLYPNTHVEGLENVMHNLNKEIEGIRARGLKGLIMAAAFIRRETESTPPLTPVDYGNLRASWFVVTASSIPAGKSNDQFKGPKAGEMAIEHAATLGEAQAMVKAKHTPGREFLILGYSANYGIFVHENLGANFKRPGAGPKWLEAHIQRSSATIIQIIKDNAQIKG